MNTFTQSIVENKLARVNDDLETSLRATGQTFESVTLGLGDTTIKREILPDGSRGVIHISTQEYDDPLGTSITYQQYTLENGDIVPDNFFYERKIGVFRKASILAKIAFGRVNNWDAASEFEGIVTYPDND